MTTRLDLIRSDSGDGGWSLHVPGIETPVLTGFAHWDVEAQEWTRPTPADYAEAMLRLQPPDVHKLALELVRWELGELPDGSFNQTDYEIAHAWAYVKKLLELADAVARREENEAALLRHIGAA